MAIILTPIEANESIPAGQYDAVFHGIEQAETSKGQAYKWMWQADNGMSIYDFTDVVQPTKANKVGRWLSALTGKPLAFGQPTDPDAYVGKRYKLIVSPAPSGDKTRLETFFALNA